MASFGQVDDGQVVQVDDGPKSFEKSGWMQKLIRAFTIHVYRGAVYKSFPAFNLVKPVYFAFHLLIVLCSFCKIFML